MIYTGGQGEYVFDKVTCRTELKEVSSYQYKKNISQMLGAMLSALFK